MKKTLFVILLLTVLLGCTNAKEFYSRQENEIKQQIYSQPEVAVAVPDLITGEFLTQDNKKIVYSFYENKNAKFAVILLHMLDRNRHEWDKFAKLLQTAGYSALSIDLRGHGNSTKEWRWRAFSERDFRAMTLDLNAAKEFLKTKNFEQFVIIGASIGANTALNYGVIEPAVKAIVLISPGLDHRGIKIEESILKNNKPTLLIASEEDLYALTTSKEIFDKTTNKIKDYRYYKEAGHGTDIFKKERADLLILDWLVQKEFR